MKGREEDEVTAVKMADERTDTGDEKIEEMGWRDGGTYRRGWRFDLLKTTPAKEALALIQAASRQPKSN